MRWLKFIGIAALSLVLLAAGGLVYLQTTDLGRYKHTVERAITKATGRTLIIAGRFEPDIGLTSSLVATDISFAGADWGEEPAMVQAGHLSVSIDLWSLIWRPIVVHRLELRDAEIRLEADEQGRSNWELGLAGEADKKEKVAKRVPTVFQNVEVNNLEISYRDRPAARKLTVVIDRLTEHPDETGLLTVDARGRLDERPIELAGHIGPMSNLLADEDVRYQLSGSIGGVQLELQGQIAELATLSQPDLRLELRADDLRALSDILDLGNVGEGKLNARGRLSPDPEGVAIAFGLELGAIRASADGTVDALLNSEALDLRLTASGPSLAPLNAFIRGIPEGPFAVNGRLRKKDSSYLFENVEMRLGENEAKVNGRLGQLPQLTGTRIEFETSGADLSVFSSMAGIPLEAKPFLAQGRLDWESGVLKLDGVDARIGDNRLSLDGVIGPPPKLVGTSLRIRANGPDFSAIPLVASYAGAPAEAFQVEGQLRIKKARYEIDTVRATLGELTVRADGIVGLPPDLKGTDLRVEAEGPDLSRLRPYARVDGLPTVPYSVSGRVRARKSRYFLDKVLARVGPAEFTLEGELGASSDLVGTAIEFQATVPNVALFEPVVAGIRLPNLPFASSGRIRVTRSGYEIGETRAQLGNATVRVEGIVGRTPDLSGTNLNFEAAAPDLSLLAPFVEDLNLPAQSFSSSGQLRVSKKGYLFRDTVAKLGDATLRVDGTVGKPPKLIDTNVSFVAEGPDLSALAAMARLTAPAESFRISGRAERLSHGLRLLEASATVGEHQLELTGLLGEPPALAGTMLDFNGKGPDLGLISELAGLDRSLSDEPFEISGRFDGSPEVFSLRHFTARLGESDLSGSLDLDLRKKPGLKGEFSSRYIDLETKFAEVQSKPVIDQPGGEAKPATPVPETGSQPAGQSKYLIPDTPLDFKALDALNATVLFTAEKVRSDLTLLSDVDLRLRLRDGTLEIDRISARDPVRGGVSATATLTPADSGYHVVINGTTDGLRLGLLAGTGGDPANVPPLNLVVAFDGRGISLHQMAASGNGRIELNQGSGRINNSALNRLVTDLSLQLLNALNPYRRNEAFSRLECGVFGVTIVDGVATLEPFAARTDKITAVGAGQIDFKTERINLTWSTRPRRGLGISASAITNRFIQFGGTLSSPALTLNPTGAAISTGAAVATGGLSLLAEGLWDRLRAEEDVCKAARERLSSGPSVPTLIEKLLR